MLAGIFIFAAIVSHSSYSVPMVVLGVVFLMLGTVGIQPHKPAGQVPQTREVHDLDAAAKRSWDTLKGG